MGGTENFLPFEDLFVTQKILNSMHIDPGRCPVICSAGRVWVFFKRRCRILPAS